MFQASFLNVGNKALSCRRRQTPLQNGNQFLLLVSRQMVCGFQDIGERCDRSHWVNPLSLLMALYHSLRPPRALILQLAP